MEGEGSEAVQADFGTGNIYKHILRLAGPMFLAQLVQMLYSVVDRVYIGNLQGASSLALTGLGLTFPIITIITAVTNLFGMGGAPLFSIARGAGNEERAGLILGNTLTLLFISSIVLTVFGLMYAEKLLWLLGASPATLPYAKAYLKIYLCGTPFCVLGLGLNGFIHAQGFGKMGMYSVLIGAVLNLILDPLFIFGLDMGIAGSAIATVIAQMATAVFVLLFLTGKRVPIAILKKHLPVSFGTARKIMALGTAGFVMSASGGLVQMAANTMLKSTGGDIYVGVMTVVNSVREMVFLPAMALTSAAQPVIGFNFGAGKSERVLKTIRFITGFSVIYMLLSWGLIVFMPALFIEIFTKDATLMQAGIGALRIYFFGSFLMSMQMAGQSTFVGLGLSKKAVFFSLLRKVLIVVPLTLILPKIGTIGVHGVFYAEPISNAIGGIACYAAMLITVRRMFKKA